MNAVKLSLCAGLLMLAFSSCGPTLSPFTEQLYRQNRWSENELKRIQFYLSEDIVMRRELTGSKSEIVSGEIKMIDGRQVEEVVIRKGTPGVLLFLPEDNRFAISFEDGGKERFLVFGPNPKVEGRYVLLASEWKRRAGMVTYEGKKWNVDNRSAYASLLVDLKKVNKISVESRTARGRRVD
ncbi:MAG: hypothetical protein KDD19_05300 [Phaeodactylibacter sp.]|nr:hypothetical protein [Phaeodactylibacter sp.]MCB9052011.1 hypothetical protein [Lewinellaceae bacterium]